VSQLPSGTVTFLFTDMESSTQLVQRLGERYGPVLDDHRRLIRTAVDEAGGHEIDCRADEFFIAFQSAKNAVAAAATAQRAFLAHPWPEDARVRIRIGIHTGEPQMGDAGYLGLDVHRAARLCAVGHGGQVLLSETTRNLLADGAPLGTSVTELGEITLHGFERPERIYQLEADDLPSGFPPPRGIEGPGPETAFEGRERELAEAAAAAVVAQPEPEPEPEPQRLRAVIADDAVLLREGVARLLEDAGFEIVAQSGTREDVLRHVAMHKPDVAIVDIRMPPTHTDEGLRAAKEIRERHPDVGVLVLSQYVEPAYALELLSESAEGIGYLLKDRVSDLDEFAAAVRRVAEGGSALDPSVVSQLVGRRRRADPLEILTPREREVLEHMAEGRSNAAIAQKLFITPRAVEKHVTSIFGKLRLTESPEDHRRVLAVLTYLRN
jgi:DNA-binding NarL/FixJ family response regulator/class 3 adenylate cyclase